MSIKELPEEDGLAVKSGAAKKSLRERYSEEKSVSEWQTSLLDGTMVAPAP